MVAPYHQVSSMILGVNLPDTGWIGVRGTVDAATSAVLLCGGFRGGTLISSMTGYAGESRSVREP